MNRILDSYKIAGPQQWSRFWFSVTRDLVEFGENIVAMATLQKNQKKVLETSFLNEYIRKTELNIDFMIKYKFY